MRQKANRPLKLSEPQQSLVDKLTAGADLLHDAQASGLFLLTEAGRRRTIHPATVNALLANGVLTKDFFGRLLLTSSGRT